MGQVLCPFPKMIPVPTGDLLHVMNECGIKIHGKVYKFDACDQEFIEYTLPPNWTIVNKSFRGDILNHYFVDENGINRFYISGVWKGFYDNEISVFKI